MERSLDSISAFIHDSMNSIWLGSRPRAGRRGPGGSEAAVWPGHDRCDSFAGGRAPAFHVGHDDRRTVGSHGQASFLSMAVGVSLNTSYPVRSGADCSYGFSPAAMRRAMVVTTGLVDRVPLFDQVLSGPDGGLEAGRGAGLSDDRGTWSCVSWRPCGRWRS